MNGHQSIQRLNCRSCRAPILLVRTLKDRQMPLDRDPSPDGNVQLLRSTDGARAQVLSTAELAAFQLEQIVKPVDERQPLYLPHFATCPNAAGHRRRDRSSAPPAPRSN